MNISKIILDVIIGILLVVAISVIGFRIAGFVPFTVESNSMSPEYKTNTLIFVRQTPFDKLKENDVITYVNSNNNSVTHRIVAIDKENKVVITKGDNNEWIDVLPVSEENILGKVMCKVPLSDKVITFIKNCQKG